MKALAIDQIERSAGAQVRVKIDHEIVEEYAELYRQGADMPDVVVFHTKADTFILADGFHRTDGAELAGKKTIGVEVRKGEARDAFEYALGANQEHGLRRSSADKRNAVQLVLKDPHYKGWSLRHVGELCGVSHTTVKRIDDENKGKTKAKTVTKLQQKNGKAEPRPRKKSPDQNELDRSDLLQWLKDRPRLPYDGTEAFSRLDLEDEIDGIATVAQWLTEMVEACDG